VKLDVELEDVVELVDVDVLVVELVDVDALVVELVELVEVLLLSVDLPPPPHAVRAKKSMEIDNRRRPGFI